MTINYQRTRKRTETLNTKNIVEREALALTLLVNGVHPGKVANITKLPLREILFQSQREEVLQKKHWIEACQLEKTLQALQENFEIDKAFAETFVAGYKEFYDDHFADLQAKLQEQGAEPAPKPDQNQLAREIALCLIHKDLSLEAISEATKLPWEELLKLVCNASII